MSITRDLTLVSYASIRNPVRCDGEVPDNPVMRNQFILHDMSPHCNTHCFVHFNWSLLTPEPATVISAHLRIYRKDDGSGPDKIYVHRVLRSFVPAQMKWAQWKSGSNWSVAGGEGNGTDRSATIMADLSGQTIRGAWALVPLNLSEFNLMKNAKQGLGLYMQDIGHPRYYSNITWVNMMLRVTYTPKAQQVIMM